MEKNNQNVKSSTPVCGCFLAWLTSPSLLGVGHGSGCTASSSSWRPRPRIRRPQDYSPPLKPHWGPFQVLGDTEPLPRPWKQKASPPPVKAWANLALSEAGQVQPRLPAPPGLSGAPPPGVILLNSDHWGLVEFRL